MRPIPLKDDNWYHYCEWLFRMHRLSHGTWIHCHICVSSFISSQCSYHNDIATVATFSFMRAGGSWWLVGWIFGILGYDNTQPFRACVYAGIRQRCRTFHATGYWSGKLRKGLELHYKWCISVIKIRWKLQLVRFSYNEKSANVVMSKDKEWEYISSAWNKQQ